MWFDKWKRRKNRRMRRKRKWRYLKPVTVTSYAPANKVSLNEPIIISVRQVRFPELSSLLSVKKRF